MCRGKAAGPAHDTGAFPETNRPLRSEAQLLYVWFPVNHRESGQDAASGRSAGEAAHVSAAGPGCAAVASPRSVPLGPAGSCSPRTGTLFHAAPRGSRLGGSSSCGFTIRGDWPSRLFLLEGFIWETRHPFGRHLSLPLMARWPEPGCVESGLLSFLSPLQVAFISPEVWQVVSLALGGRACLGLIYSGAIGATLLCLLLLLQFLCDPAWQGLLGAGLWQGWGLAHMLGRQRPPVCFLQTSCAGRTQCSGAWGSVPARPHRPRRLTSSGAADGAL